MLRSDLSMLEMLLGDEHLSEKERIYFGDIRGLLVRRVLKTLSPEQKKRVKDRFEELHLHEMTDELDGEFTIRVLGMPTLPPPRGQGAV